MTGTKKQNSYTPSTKEYRALSGLNQSMLKRYDEDPGIFFQEFILGHPKKDRESAAMIIGNVVDFFLLDCNGDEREFEQRNSEKFALFDGIKSSAQAFDLADELFKITLRDTVDGVVQSELIDRLKEAFLTVQGQKKYKGKTWDKDMGKILDDFNDVAKEYFDKKIQNIGKIVVDSWQLEKARNVAQQAQGDEFLGEYINKQSDDNVEIIKKHVIEFEMQARHQKWQCKMEQDETRIDHDEQIIYRNDYKAYYDNEEFDYSYLKRQLYLQNSFYHIGTKIWAKQNGLESYRVEPMSFIVFDTSINNRRPLKWDTTNSHVESGLNGFTYRGQKYRGVLELIEAIDWANHNGIWNISKENYVNKAVVTLKNYEDE